MSDFQYLKHKTSGVSKFKNMKTPVSWCRSPGANSSDVKGNEADRKVRCKICGFICDRERDVRLPEGSFAGLGISYGSQQTAGSSVGDRWVYSDTVDLSSQYILLTASETTSVKLLLHFDGSDGSNTFTDSAGRHTVTANGNVQIDTAQGVFSQSGLFDGNGDYLSIPD